MPRKRRSPKQRRAEVPADVFALLSDGEGNHPVRFFMTDIEIRAAWDRVRDEILAEWINDSGAKQPEKDK